MYITCIAISKSQHKCCDGQSQNLRSTCNVYVAGTGGYKERTLVERYGAEGARAPSLRLWNMRGGGEPMHTLKISCSICVIQQKQASKLLLLPEGIRSTLAWSRALRAKISNFTVKTRACPSLTPLNGYCSCPWSLSTFSLAAFSTLKIMIQSPLAGHIDVIPCSDTEYAVVWLSPCEQLYKIGNCLNF